MREYKSSCYRFARHGTQQGSFDHENGYDHFFFHATIERMSGVFGSSMAGLAENREELVSAFPMDGCWVKH